MGPRSHTRFHRVALSRAAHRRPKELFTDCDRLLTFLLPQRLYHLYVIIEKQRDLICHRVSQWLIRAYSSETMLSYSRNASLLTKIECID